LNQTCTTEKERRGEGTGCCFHRGGHGAVGVKGLILAEGSLEGPTELGSLTKGGKNKRAVYIPEIRKRRRAATINDVEHKNLNP